MYCTTQCVLDRFDNYEVLGDRISISWYKDVRKARAYGKILVGTNHSFLWFEAGCGICLFPQVSMIPWNFAEFGIGWSLADTMVVGSLCHLSVQKVTDLAYWTSKTSKPTPKSPTPNVAQF